MTSVKLLFKSLVNLVYPLSCQVCKSPLTPENDRFLCHDCWEKIQKNPPPFCAKCGRSLPGLRDSAYICGDCQRSEYHFNRAWAACLYEGVVKECIHLVKYSKKLCLVKPLSQLVLDFATTYLDMKAVDQLVPIPLHSAKLREREFNQAELIASRIKASFNIPIVSDNLRRIKLRPPQTTLPRKERIRNLNGAFKIKNPSQFRQRSILLIDDVFTTGSTVNECSKVLLEAGAKKVDVLTLARGA